MTTYNVYLSQITTKLYIFEKKISDWFKNNNKKWNWRFKEFKAIGFGMIGLVIGLLLIFFWSHDRTGTRPRDEDTCCKEVQVQEKTGVTTTLITSPTKSLIARSEMSSESYCIITSCKTITFSSIFSSDPGQIGSCLSVFQVFFSFIYVIH